MLFACFYSLQDRRKDIASPTITKAKIESSRISTTASQRISTPLRNKYPNPMIA